MQHTFRFAVLMQAFLWLGLCAIAAENKPAAKELKFNVILIWGTDGEKPAGENLRDVDAKVEEKLRECLKWKNYYEVSRQPLTIKMGEKKRLVMSPKCEVEASYSEQNGLEVELFGEGKSVIKSRQAMPLKEPFAVAGPAKNQTAWAVVLKPEN